MEHTADELHELLMNLVRLTSALHPEPTIGTASVPLSQTFALHELDLNGPLSQRDLAERLHLEKSTVSRLVAEMAADDLLVRDRDPENRRYYRLQITERGRQMHATMTANFHGRYDQLVANMSDDERDALIRGLPGLIRALREQLSSAEIPDALPHQGRQT